MYESVLIPPGLPAAASAAGTYLQNENFGS